MNRLLFLSVLGFSVVASSAQARLGETLAQCVARYGAVMDPDKPASVKESDPKVSVFSKDGITVVVEFKGGIAWRIVFRKADMSPAEVETLLKANLPEGGWGPAQKIDGQDFRLSADRRRIAIYSPTKAATEISTLTLATRDYGAANYAAYSAKVREALSTVKERKIGKDLKGF